jgi:transposase
MRDKHQNIEEPCEGKLSCTVLKTSETGDCLAEFNTFAVMSNGEQAESPSYKKLDRKVRKLQRKGARQPKDSKRRNVTRIKIAKLHNRIADTRKDFLHKLSTKIVNENQVIVLEDLNVSGMVKNRKLALGNQSAGMV